MAPISDIRHTRVTPITNSISHLLFEPGHIFTINTTRTIAVATNHPRLTGFLSSLSAQPMQPKQPLLLLSLPLLVQAALVPSQFGLFPAGERAQDPSKPCVRAQDRQQSRTPSTDPAKEGGRRTMK